jgi:hypothetical protein
MARSLQLAVLATQPAQFVALRCGETVVTFAGVAIGLRQPVVDRLGRGLEFLRQLLGRSPRSHQFNHLRPEFRRVRTPMSLHNEHLLIQRMGVHKTGATPVNGPHSQVGINAYQTRVAVGEKIQCGFVGPCSVPARGQQVRQRRQNASVIINHGNGSNQRRGHFFSGSSSPTKN